MPVSAQAAFAVCAGLLFLVGVLDAVGVIPLLLRMLSVDAEAEAAAEERAGRRERAGGGSSRSAALLRSSRSAGSSDSVRGRGGGVGGSQSYAFGRGASRLRAAALTRSPSKGGRWKGLLSDDEERAGGPLGPGLKPRRSKLREVVQQAPGADRPLAFAASGSYSSGGGTSGGTYSDSGGSSAGRPLYSTDGEGCGDGSSVTAWEKGEPLSSDDWSTDSEGAAGSGGGGGGGGECGGRGGGGGLRRSGSGHSAAQRAYGHADDGDARWLSGSDVEVGRPAGKGTGSSRRATFSTPAVEQILTPRSGVLPAVARADKVALVVPWERLLGAFLCVCSVLSLFGSYVAMHGLPEVLFPGRRLLGGGAAAAAAAAPTVLQEEQS